MKQTIVLKALNSMEEKRVNQFLNDDFRNFGEIIEAVCDEVEVGYVEFMYELIQKCKAIEAEEKSMLVSSLANSLKDDNCVKIVSKSEEILTAEQCKKLHEIIKEMPPIHSMFNIPKMDFSNLVQRKN
jgi:hypothetical protein